MVIPPSIHPDTGGTYRWVTELPPADPPGWLLELVSPAAPPPQPVSRWVGRGARFSTADEFIASATWEEILGRHGWSCLDVDSDADGARWVHPTATSPQSATVRHRCLFVYSTSTPFDDTVAGDPHGYTKFRAYAVLEHAGDLSAAARTLRDRRR